MMPAWLVSPLSLESGLAFFWPALLLALRASLVLAVSWAATRLLRSSAARHLVWSIALVGLLLLPFGSLLPALELAVLPPVRAALDTPRIETVIETEAASPADPGEARQPHHSRVLGSEASPTATPTAEGPGAEAIGPIDRPTEARHGSVRSFETLLPLWLVAVWLGGVGILTGRIIGGLAARRRLLTGATAIEDGRREQLERLAGKLAISRPVRLLESPVVQVPMTWGTFDPVVLLPRRARRWSGELLESVLLHELVHVKRHDAAAGLLGSLVTALYWPHPLVWAAARALRLESELACDDEVVRTSGSAVRYAEHLLRVVEALRRAVPRTVAAMASGPRLAGRIGAILDESRQRSAPGRAARLLIGLGAAVLVGAAAVPVTLAAGSPVGTGSFVALGAAQGADLGKPESESEVATEPSVASSSAPATLPASTRVSNRASTRARSSTERSLPTSTSIPMSSPEAPESGRASEGDPGASSSGGATEGRLFAEGCGDGSHAATSFHIDDDRLRVRVQTGQCELRIDSVGKIGFSSDERSVTSVSRRGRMAIEERRPEATRRIEVERGADGGPQISWTVDGRSEPLDARAEEWLASMIPQIYRITGWEAEKRVDRILAAGGPEAVFDEISLIFGDHVQRLYLSELLEKGRLEGEDLRRWIEVAGRELGSDYELGQVLQALPLDELREPATQKAFIEAAASIGSDNGLRQTLEHLLQQGHLSRELLEPLLEVARSIGSDFELSELVVTIAAQYPRDVPLPAAFYDVVGTIGSDHEMRRALGQVIGRPMASGDLVRALDLSKQIGSDYELAELLVELVAQYPADEPLPAEFFDAAATIGSDHEMHRALSAVIGRPMADEETNRLLELSREIGSDFELAELLIELVRQRGVPQGSREVFQATVETIGNSAERQRVLDVWGRTRT